MSSSPRVVIREDRITGSSKNKDSRRITKDVRNVEYQNEMIEEYLNKKKSEFLEEAGSKAEQFFATQMEILDQRIEKKIIEIEKKVNEKIRAVFWLFLISTFVIMTLAGLTFSLIFRYFNF